MQLLKYGDFLECGKIPFYDDISSKLVDYHQIRRDSAIIIFVSYVWYSNYAQSSSDIISPSSLYAPDDPKTLKVFSLIKDGVNILVDHMTAASFITDSYLWIDCACMDISDGSFMKKKMNLWEIIGNCDCLLTPLQHVDSFFFESEDLYDSVSCGVYHSWIGAPSSYLSRGWCRLEFWCGMVLPCNLNQILPEDTSQQRFDGFKGSFVECLRENHRPHYLYAKDEEGLQHLFLLPRINPSLFEQLSPDEGELGRDNDRILIQTETIILKNYLQQLMNGYEGELNKGLKHGKGKLKYSDGSYYEGDWKNDVKEGTGKYIFPNGEVYEGQFSNDCIAGEGKLAYNTGNLYEGQFMNNLPHGEGDYYYKDGNMYRGAYLEGKRCGKGRYTFSAGGFYEGEFRNDLRHGNGVYFYPNGCKYEGEFEEDHRHGYGKYFYDNGDIYEGDFKIGHFNGIGRYVSKDGDVYEGEYKDDKKHGKGTLVHRTGIILGMEFDGGIEVSSKEVLEPSSVPEKNEVNKSLVPATSSAIQSNMMPHMESPHNPKNPRSSFCVIC